VVAKTVKKATPRAAAMKDALDAAEWILDEVQKLQSGIVREFVEGDLAEIRKKARIIRTVLRTPR